MNKTKRTRFYLMIPVTCQYTSERVLRQAVSEVIGDLGMTFSVMGEDGHATVKTGKARRIKEADRG